MSSADTSVKSSGLIRCQRCGVMKEREHRDCRVHKSKRYRLDLESRYSNHAFAAADSAFESWRLSIGLPPSSEGSAKR
jgi:hypothetical protein